MKLFFIIGCFLTALPLWSQNYLIQGKQESVINYQLTQSFIPAGDTRLLKLSFVIPESFKSPTTTQHIEKFKITTFPEPEEKIEKQDKRGNRIVEMSWSRIKGQVNASVSFISRNTTALESLKSEAPYPLKNLSENTADYLKSTEQVQSDHPSIRTKAHELVKNAQTEFDAVRRILTWLVDHMRYVSPPAQYDALYSFQSGLGNCQNYSHLAAALMRAAGIPVRIVNGITLEQPYTARTGEGEMTFKMGQGRHSWIEVYFPDIGWMPYEPQQTELFVPNRFVRIEVGVDNEETMNDGMIRFRQASNISDDPEFTEIIEAEFAYDEVDLIMTRQAYGPSAMLICPNMQAVFQPVRTDKPPVPDYIPPDKLDQMVLDRPVVFGNMDFPRNINFASSRDIVEKDEMMVLQKNFIVETAEYVTTKLTKYAQVVEFSEPLRLSKVGLALHKFGGSGQLWIELLEDDNGAPGKPVSASDIIDLEKIPVKQGYDWIDFSFLNEKIILGDSRYWIALGFTGSPIINWFYTYGKPVGPAGGTRYKDVFEETWSGALAYEFNYRVAGWAPKK